MTKDAGIGDTFTVYNIDRYVDRGRFNCCHLLVKLFIRCDDEDDVDDDDIALQQSRLFGDAAGADDAVSETSSMSSGSFHRSTNNIPMVCCVSSLCCIHSFIH